MKSYDKALDEALDNMITEALTDINQQEGENLASCEENITFSPEHEEKMKKLFARTKRQTTLNTIRFYSLRVACVLLVVVLISAVSVFSVDAWRVRFLNLIFDEDAPASDLNFSSLGGSHYSNDYIGLNYIPEGYELTQEIIRNGRVGLVFTKGDSYITLTVHSVDGDAKIDTEDSTLENLEINGREAVLITKDDYLQLIWHNDISAFYLSGTLTRKDILLIAENLKYFG